MGRLHGRRKSGPAFFNANIILRLFYLPAMVFSLAETPAIVEDLRLVHEAKKRDAETTETSGAGDL